MIKTLGFLSKNSVTAFLSCSVVSGFPSILEVSISNCVQILIKADLVDEPDSIKANLKPPSSKFFLTASPTTVLPIPSLPTTKNELCAKSPAFIRVI